MANQSGWQIGITLTNPEEHAEDEWPTEEQERAAMIHAGIEPEDRVDSGVYIASIPIEWTTPDNTDEHEIVGPDGRKWTIEVPLP